MKSDQVTQVCRRVVGMRAHDAKEFIVNEGLIYRIVSQDGMQFGGDSAFVPYRINLEVMDDVVRESRVG